LLGNLYFDADATAKYRAFWAFSDVEERTAFERVVDEIMGAWDASPGMHIYHYAPYEPAAFKRLMGRHATREAEVDRMLRAGLFVDLYAIVKHSLRASVEQYSIKDLEPFYGFERGVALEDARTSLRVIERALELGAIPAISPDVRAAVEGYNFDDCLSTSHLRRWLEGLRASIEAQGTEVPRPELKEGAPPERVDNRARRVRELMGALIAGIPPERSERDDQQQARWLLAHMLDWHRREAKAPWWEFFRLRDLTDEELLVEKAALSGLRFVERVGGTERSPIDRYRYPPQDTEVGEGDSLHLPDGTNFGTVETIDRAAYIVEIKKRRAQAETHPAAVFAHSVVKSDVLADALLRIADDVIEHGIAGGTDYKAARGLLLGLAPRLRTGLFQAQPGESAVQFAVRIASDLDRTVLPIQGPPGAGKTFTGAQMICELVRRGLRVGVTAVSHKVIRNLVDATLKAANECGLPISCVHKVTRKSGNSGPVEEIIDNGECLDRLRDGRASLLGGTPWLWARPDAHGAADVLFVDEAGQMSLANVLAASQGAASVVLLGDPQQLEQPQQGTHPEGTEASALDHILRGHKTVPDDLGIFLPETWRLAPAICAFTSEVFYEGKLHARAGLERVWGLILPTPAASMSPRCRNAPGVSSNAFST
jgi:uncharacterized protein